MSSGATEEIILFSNGTEYDLYMARNCNRCLKAGDASDAGSSPCDLFELIHDTACGVEEPTEEHVKRLGLDRGDGSVAVCTEFNQPTKADLGRLATWNALSHAALDGATDAAASGGEEGRR